MIRPDDCLAITDRHIVVRRGELIRLVFEGRIELDDHGGFVMRRLILLTLRLSSVHLLFKLTKDIA